MGLGLIAAETFLHTLINALLIAAIFHVDEIEDDQPAHIAQAKLPANLVGGLDVHFENRRFLIFAAFVAASVDVDGDERFGFIHYDITAAFQVDLS